MKVFEEIVEKYSHLIDSAIRKVCKARHVDLIPDVRQEVHLALWKIAEDGKKIDHPVSYYYKVALTTALRVLKKHAPPQQADEPPDAHDLSVATGSPSKTYEHRQQLERILAQLPREQSLALTAYLNGFNHKEIAKAFGWSESQARHRIYRSLELLRKEQAHETPS